MIPPSRRLRFPTSRFSKPFSGVMEIDEADAGHARKVAVTGPNRGVVIGRNGGDQKVRETETLSCRPRHFQPVVYAHPGLLSREEKRQCRECTTQRNMVPA